VSIRICRLIAFAEQSDLSQAQGALDGKSSKDMIHIKRIGAVSAEQLSAPILRRKSESSMKLEAEAQDGHTEQDVKPIPQWTSWLYPHGSCSSLCMNTDLT
jgi:hypothetical protein